MRAAILGLPHGEFNDDVELETDTSQHIPAIVVEETQYLDGVSIYHGTAAGRVDTSDTQVYVDQSTDKITTEREEFVKEVTTDFYADFDAGWVGVDTSDGEFIWRLVGPTAGAVIQRAILDLDAFTEDYERRDDADCWQIGHSQNDRAGVAYHDDADILNAPVQGISQLGFEYWWDGQVVRGTVAASGYVAVYSGMSVEAFGRWIRDEILPYAGLPDQEELPESNDEVTECEECGRDPEKDLEETEAGMLCVVCADKHEDEQEQAAVEKLRTVKMADGGENDA